MRKSILLIGYNYFPELTGIGKYSGEMIQWLARQGYACTVITAYPYYPYWQVQEPYYRNRFRYQQEDYSFASGGSIRVYRCPMYIPDKPSGLKRIILDVSFLASAFIKLVQVCFSKGIDFVITTTPAFHFGFLGMFYKKVKGAKFMYHIHDMQIEAAHDLKMVKSKSLIDFLLKTEKYILDKADMVSSVSEQMVIKTQFKTSNRVVLFPNWVDTNVFFPLQDKEPLKQKIGFQPSDKLVLYSGAVGEKQGLEAIVQAAREFRHQLEVKFIICGSGPYKDKLMALVDEMHLDNVVFFPLQPIEEFNDFLNAADLHLVIQKSNASDLMMPSKLTTILAVGGLALITANEGSGLYMLVQDHSIGLVAEAENQRALNESIREGLYANHEHTKRNARLYAENHLYIDKIMTNFEKHLD